jgi:Polysaccharide pyruvyl transferase.
MVSALARYGKVGAYSPEFFALPIERYDPWIHSSRRHRLLARLRGGHHYLVNSTGGWGPIVRCEKVETDAPAIVSRNPLQSVWRKWLDPRRIVLGFSVNISPDDSRFDKYYWIGARDNTSLESLQRRGLNQATYFPDWAFFDPLVKNSSGQRHGVAASFRTRNPDQSRRLSTTDLHESLRQLRHHFGEITFFHQVTEDADFEAQLHLETPKSNHRSRALDIDSYQQFYRRFPVVASNRLHCLLFGAMNGALPIALVDPGHTKIVSLYRTLRWHDLLVFLDDRGPDALANIVRNFDSLSRMVAQTCATQRQVGEALLASRFARGPHEALRSPSSPSFPPANDESVSAPSKSLDWPHTTSGKQV